MIPCHTLWGGDDPILWQHRVKHSVDTTSTLGDADTVLWQCWSQESVPTWHHVHAHCVCRVDPIPWQNGKHSICRGSLIYVGGGTIPSCDNTGPGSYSITRRWKAEIDLDVCFQLISFPLGGQMCVFVQHYMNTQYHILCRQHTQIPMC